MEKPSRTNSSKQNSNRMVKHLHTSYLNEDINLPKLKQILTLKTKKFNLVKLKLKQIRILCPSLAENIQLNPTNPPLLSFCYGELRQTR